MDTVYINQVMPHVLRVKGILERSDRSDDAKALLILHILLKLWKSDRKITQLEIAEMIPNCGHHELWEMRRGTSMETTVRKVRGIIERVLRKQYRLPVLSTPGKGTIASNTAGYWLVRHRSEALEYVHRRQAEIERTYHSGRRTIKAICDVCQIKMPPPGSA